MFMFGFHIAFSLALIALALGAKILIKSQERKNKGIAVIAYVIIVAAILNIACSSFYAVKYWMSGPNPAMMAMMQNRMTMMQENPTMQNNKMMKR